MSEKEKFNLESVEAFKEPQDKQEAVDATPEKEKVERQLNPEEVVEFKGELDEYVEGLKTRVSELEAELEEIKKTSPEWETFERTKEIQDELAYLKEYDIDDYANSSAAIEEAGDAAIVKIKQ